MGDDNTASVRLGCAGCLVLIVLLGAALGLAWGLMTGIAHYIGGLFA